MKKLLITQLLTFSFFAVAIKSHAQWQLTGNSNATATSILGTTNSVPLRLFTKNTPRLVIDTLGRVGIGITIPTTQLMVRGSGGNPAAIWTNIGKPVFAGFGETNVGNADFILGMASSTLFNAIPRFAGRRSRGTLNVPEAVINGDQLMSFSAFGYDGTTFQNPAAVEFTVDGTQSGTSVPTNIVMATGSNGVTRTERLRIGSNGDIVFNTSQFFVQKSTGNAGLGTTAPSAKLEVAGQVKITGGAPGAGKILTSDAAGLASWQTPAAGTETDPQVAVANTSSVPRWNGTALVDGTIKDNGNVGIGESNPQGILHVSQSFSFAGVTFTGSGLNDLSVNVSGFTGNTTVTYVIRIQNSGPTPNSIEISNDGGANFSAPVPINNPVLLANNVTATFANTGGHTFGDQWSWTVEPNFNNELVVKRGKIGINTANPDTSAVLDINSNNKGILISRLTNAQKNLIFTPATGLLIYQTDSVPGFYFYNGSEWLNLTTSSAVPSASANQFLSNLSPITSVNRSLLPVSSDSVSLGDTTKIWKNLFLNGSIYNGSARIVSIDTVKGNIFVGDGTGTGNTNGLSNIALGKNALTANTSGTSNIAIGTGALFNNNGSNVTAIGDSALFNYNGGDGFNTAVGSKTMVGTTTGSNNTACGNSVLYFNTTGNFNTAIGSMALTNNTIGGLNTATGYTALSGNTTGSSNTANGAGALTNNTIGSDNTAYGRNALGNNTLGASNTSIGKDAMLVNIEGSFNTAVGASSLKNNAGNSNTAVGNNALLNNTGASFNTALGQNALTSNTTGNQNTATGNLSLSKNTTGIRNTATGNDALRDNVTGNDNTACGNDALIKNTTGSSNTANGEEALNSNTTGSSNTANGYRSLYLNTTGLNNTAFGITSLFSNKSGSNNTATGMEALFNNTLGGFNTAIGKSALVENTTGFSNTAIGSGSITKNTTGSYNTADGDSALFNNTAAQFNTAVGYKAGANFANGFNNVFLGANTDVNAAGVFNSIVIGQGTTGTASNQVTVGNAVSNSYRVYANWTNISDGRYKKNIQQNVPGLTFINKLTPVTYHLDATGLDAFLNKRKQTDSAAFFYKKALAEKENILYTGFIAQDVEKAAKELNYDFSGVDAPKNDKDVYGLRYAEFVVPLVKAVQELSKENEQLKMNNEQSKVDTAALQKQIDDLKAMMQQLMNAKSSAPCPPLAGK